MPLDNMVAISFTPQELADLNNALTSIEATLKAKMVNLTPEERNRYAAVSVSTERAPWIEKCRSYMNQTPNLVPGYINLPRLDADIRARNDIIPVLNRVKSIWEGLDDTNVLIGVDVYTNCLSFYRSVKAAAQANVPGSTTIYEDLARQFPGKNTAERPEPSSTE
ncbi:MAG: hypothetical protein HZA49_01245 [Planctomycetes bacterium]|nr:hypothetical protein [Planctomycetota bacterium]